MFDSWIEALINPAVALSGFALLIFPLLRKLNPIPILAQTIEEQNFLSRETKWYRKTLLNILFMLFSCSYSLFVFSSDIFGFSLYNVMNRMSGTWLIIYLTLTIISFLYLGFNSIPVFQKWIREKVYKRPKFKSRRIKFTLLSLIVILIYGICILSFYSISVISFLEMQAKNKEITINERYELFTTEKLYDSMTIKALIILTLLCLLLLAIVPKVFKFLSYSESVAHITLKDGYVTRDVYIFNPNLKNGIMISYSNNSYADKTFIPNDNINRIDFTTVYYLLGRRLSSIQDEIVTDLNSLSAEEEIVVDQIIPKRKYRKHF